MKHPWSFLSFFFAVEDKGSLQKAIPTKTLKSLSQQKQPLGSFETIFRIKSKIAFFDYSSSFLPFIAYFKAILPGEKQNQIDY